MSAANAGDVIALISAIPAAIAVFRMVSGLLESNTRPRP
jgi:hypothetical protein